MHKEKRILGLIPARGGSKRLPGKNIRQLLGKPMIAWTIEQALKSTLVDKVVVSTDDEAIAQVSRQFGARVPFIRPKELALDNALSVDVAIHALDFLRKHGEQYDYLALLEPTSPLRKPGDIDEGIVKLIDHPEADNLISLGAIHLEHPSLVKKLQGNLVFPYTDMPQIDQSRETGKAYFPYGVIYLSKVESLYKRRNFYAGETLPLFIERWQNYEVDDEIDLFIIEIIMQKYLARVL